jgi:dynein heavy chain, axonemal
MTMGEEFVNPVNSPLEEVFNDTDYKTPLIFILSPGADPLMNLMVLYFTVAFL